MLQYFSTSCVSLVGSKERDSISMRVSPLDYAVAALIVLLPYNGIPLSKNPDSPLPSLASYMQTWATLDGCTHGPVIFLREPKATGMQWTGCRGNVSVIH